MLKNRDTPDWQASLGGSKRHYIFLVRNTLSLIPFIRKIQLIIRKNLAFLDYYIPDKSRPDMRFLLFFTKIQRGWDEYFILLPNRITVPPIPESKADARQGLFLFDDELYLFNRQGQFLIACDPVDCDYIFLLLCDKDSPVDDIMTPLLENRDLHIQDISPLMEKPSRKSTGNLSKESDKDLLFNFFGNIEVMINDFRTDHLKCRLAPRQTVKSLSIKYQDIHNQRFITSNLWQEEDKDF